MKLKDLITKLQGKEGQDDEIQFIVYGKDRGNIVCADMQGDDTDAIIKILTKRAADNKKIMNQLIYESKKTR